MEKQDENEDFLSRLLDTLRALCEMQGSPHDDTILHRLLDAIKQLVTSYDDARRAGLFTFLDNVTKDVSRINPSVSVLALGVAAHLVSMDTLPEDQLQKVMLVYSTVQSSAAMEDTSVGAAYFNSLANIVENHVGFEWVVKNSMHLHTALSTLEGAQSVFLLKGAESLIVTTIRKSLQSAASTSTPTPTPVSSSLAESLEGFTVAASTAIPPSSLAIRKNLESSASPSSVATRKNIDSSASPSLTTTTEIPNSSALPLATARENLQSSASQSNNPIPFASPVLQEVMQFLTEALSEMVQGRATLLDQMVMSTKTCSLHQSVVQIVSQLCECEHFCLWKCEDENFVASLVCLALHHSSEKIRSSALLSTAKLASFMARETQQKFLQKEIVLPLLKLVSEGDVEKAMAVASAFIHRSTSGPERLLILESFYQMPHDIIFGRPIQAKELLPLVPLVTAALQNKQRFSKLISSVMHSLKQIKNSEGILQLLRSASTTRDSSDWSSLLSSWPHGIGAVVMGNQRLLNSLLHQLSEENCFDFSQETCEAILSSLLHIMKRPMIESRLYSQTCSVFLSILGKQRLYHQISFKTNQMQEVMGETLNLLERCLVAMQWEVRDTTLEFIGNIISTLPDGWFLQLAQEKHLFSDAWSCLKDGESYPRASVIAMVTKLVSLPEWWAAFLQDCAMTEGSLVDAVIEVLSCDSEAFPRRAAVQLLAALCPQFSPPQIFPTSSASVSSNAAGVQCSPANFPQSSIDQESSTAFSENSYETETAQRRSKICSAMAVAMADFDWEVKVKALEFWEKMLATPVLCEKGRREKKEGDKQDGEKINTDPTKAKKSKESCYISDNVRHSSSCKIPALHGKRKSESNTEEQLSMFENLLRAGFGEAVLAGAEDYDTSVKQKALQILTAVEKIFTISDPSPTKAQKLNDRERAASDIASFQLELNFQKMDRVDSKSKQDISSITRSYDCNNKKKVPQTSSGDTDDMNQNASFGHCSNSVSHDTVSQFLHTVSQLNPALQLSNLGHSADVYDQNPSSLLEDVMAATKTTIKTSDVMLMSEDEFDDAEDMFVDCY